MLSLKKRKEDLNLSNLIDNVKNIGDVLTTLGLRKDYRYSPEDKILILEPESIAESERKKYTEKSLQEYERIKKLFAKAIKPEIIENGDPLDPLLGHKNYLSLKDLETIANSLYSKVEDFALIKFIFDELGSEKARVYSNWAIGFINLQINTDSNTVIYSYIEKFGKEGNIYYFNPSVLVSTPNLEFTGGLLNPKISIPKPPKGTGATPYESSVSTEIIKITEENKVEALKQIKTNIKYIEDVIATVNDASKSLGNHF